MTKTFYAVIVFAVLLLALGVLIAVVMPQIWIASMLSAVASISVSGYAAKLLDKNQRRKTK